MKEESKNESPTPVSEPLISIVVAYPAPTAQLDECLDGIGKQEYGNYEVILLPDDSHNLDARRYSLRETQVRVLPTGPVRPAEKRNKGVQAAKGEIIAFLDDDAYPTKGWLNNAVSKFADCSISAVGGPATTPPDDPFMAKMSGRVFANRIVSGSYIYRYVSERFRYIDDFPSCNLFVRKNIFEKVGGFRTEYWPGEDTFFCMEIVTETGGKIVYDPTVHVYHHRRRLFVPHLRQVARYALHRGYFARRFPENSRKLSYFIPSLFVVGVVAGGLLSVFSELILYLYLGTLGIYLLSALAFSFSPRPHVWFITLAGIVLTHFVYGGRFILGLLSSRMPSQKKRFDHPSENETTPISPSKERR